ncbi:MAG: diacylglycerol kinase family lipid kinase [Acetobacteraceae bacterium]|nr:diacylglycerol kinase family lipid kinase [Acetobacteraceae bacterium]
MIIVYNPTAGRRRAALLWRVLDVLAASGVRLDLARTTCAGHAATLAREAALLGARLVVAAGGDGTIAEVARGLQGTGAALGIIPLGTANVLANELDLSFVPQACAAALAFGRTRALWPGVATGASGERLFVQMLGVGFDAAVVHRLPLRLKRIAGRGAYVVQSLREMGRYPFPLVAVRLDGVEMQAASVVVTKGRLYAGRYELAPAACSAERGFQVALFGHAGALGGPLGAALYGSALPLGLLPRAPGLRLVQAREIEVSGSLPVQTDGDPSGSAPLRIVDAREPIRVVVG